MAPTRKREAMLQGVQTDRLEAVNVLTGDVIDRLLADPDRQAWLYNYVDNGANVARYDSTIPCNVFVIDELVLIGDSQPESGDPYTVIVSDNEVVRTWAVNLIDHFFDDSKPITTDFLDDEIARVGSHGEC